MCVCVCVCVFLFVFVRVGFEVSVRVCLYVRVLKCSKTPKVQSAASGEH